MLLTSLKDKTVLIQSSTSDANIQVPKTIWWKYISRSSQWILENEISQKPIISNIMNLDKISFDQSRFRTPLVLNNASISLITSRKDTFISKKDTNLLNKTTTQEVKLKGGKTQGQTSHPCYTNNESEENEQMFATQTDFEVWPINRQLLTINKQFEINWDELTNNLIKKKTAVHIQSF